MDISDSSQESLTSTVTAFIGDLGSRALGNRNFPGTLHEHSQRTGCYYLNRNGKKTAIIIGELAIAAEGTELSAHGDFFKNHDANSMITDESRIRDIYALRRPSEGPELQELYDRQVATLNEIRMHGLEREELDDRNTLVEDWTRLPDIHSHEIILIHSKLKFKRIQPSTFLEDVDRLTRPQDDQQLQVGRPYPAEVLPDYDKKIFAVHTSKLIQQDIKDNQGKLVPPWQNKAFLHPGAMLIVEGTLSCQIIRTETSTVKIQLRNIESPRNGSRYCRDSENPCKLDRTLYASYLIYASFWVCD
ncbi:hypothetical protein BDN72DRAFT_865536 [Pluteus cervinus]|uniref:Uncharacterized protein n=1 Tax=Pluteus cervinus TaxID=181527 RepID=A0ACD3A0X8_9AGAR|nr:hypothetical protein BDN72DRAFT_865536 [Pluteus cervinus]